MPSIFSRVKTKALQLVSDSSWGWLRLEEPWTGAWQQDYHATSADSALRFQAVFACVTLISQDIGKLRPKLVQQSAIGGIWSEFTSAAFSPVLRRPNHYQNRIKFFEYWIASKLIHGNAYALKEKDGRGIVTALYLLDPTRVTPLVSDVDGSVYYRLENDLLAELPEQIVVPAREIIHDPMVTLFHPLCGVSPLFACCIAAAQGMKIQTNSLKFFANMSRPSGILTAPGSIAQATADRLKAQWETNFGTDKVGKVAVLGDSLKYEPMAVNAVDAQLIEQLKWSAEMVCSAFHVPAYMVGMGTMPAYNNIEALNQQYFSQCLQSLIESLELSLDEGLDLTSVSASYGVEMDLDGLLRMDTATRYKAHSDAISGGWLAPNEARAKEDLPPVEGGETPYLQQQNYSLKALAKRDTAAPAPTSTLPVPPAATPPAADPAAAAAAGKKALERFMSRVHEFTSQAVEDYDA